MTDSPRIADLANLTPCITGAIEGMRNFEFYLTKYIDDYRRLPVVSKPNIETIRYQIDRLIDTARQPG